MFHLQPDKMLNMLNFHDTLRRMSQPQKNHNQQCSKEIQPWHPRAKAPSSLPRDTGPETVPTLEKTPELTSGPPELTLAPPDTWQPAGMPPTAVKNRKQYKRIKLRNWGVEVYDWNSASMSQWSWTKKCKTQYNYSSPWTRVIGLPLSLSTDPGPTMSNLLSPA